MKREVLNTDVYKRRSIEAVNMPLFLRRANLPYERDVPCKDNRAFGQSLPQGS